MSSPFRAVPPPVLLRTTLRNPALGTYGLLVGVALILGIQSVTMLLMFPPENAWGILASACSILVMVWALFMVPFLVWSMVRTWRIEVTFDAEGITSHVRPGFTARWGEIGAVRLLPKRSWVQIAILETPAARERRHMKWWQREWSVPRNTLIASFPRTDEPAVRAILAAHGITPQPFLPAV